MTTPDNPDDIEFVALTLIKRSTSGPGVGDHVDAFVGELEVADDGVVEALST